MHISAARTPVSREGLHALTADPWPLPGSGRTLRRWHLLRDVAAADLPLAKLVEPHHDAVAILAEIGARQPRPEEIWAVWAAEPPFAVLSAVPAGDGWELSGSKAFCSGASLVTHALVTAETERGSRLFAVARDAAGISEGSGPAWSGAGMRRAATETLSFTRVRAVAVGEPGDYVRRPGFWLGAIGIAACWLGGAHGVADTLESSSSRLDAHGLAHLGAVRAALDVADLALAGAASRVDERPLSGGEAERLAQALRAQTADLVEQVVSRVGRALGPGPLAFDAGHAEHVCDLEVFVRQHHGERDLERLGSMEAPHA